MRRGEAGFIQLAGLFGTAISGWIFYAIVAIAVVGLLWVVEGRGYARGKAELTEYIAEQATATIAARKVVEKITTRVEIEYRDRVEMIVRKGDTIVREVPIYVTKDDDSACELRNGFVRVHDAAASAGITGAPGDSDRAPSGVALSQALSTIADNYKACRVWREQVIGWQEYYPKVREALAKSNCAPAP